MASLRFGSTDIFLISVLHLLLVQRQISLLFLLMQGTCPPQCCGSSSINAAAPRGDVHIVHHLGPLLTEHRDLVPCPGSRVAVYLHEGLLFQRIQTGKTRTHSR